MKGKIILFSALALLLLFSVAAPVLAYDPKPSFSFTEGHIMIDDPSQPGTTINTENGIIVFGSGIIHYCYSSMFGYYMAHEVDPFYYLNLNTLKGYGVGIVQYPAWKMQIAWTFNGAGPYTYKGPDMAADGTTLTTGESLGGVLLTGSGTFEFTSGPYAGETGVVTFAGCWPTPGFGIAYFTYYVH